MSIGKVLIGIGALGALGALYYVWNKEKPIPFVPTNSREDLESKYPGAPEDLVGLLMAMATIINDPHVPQSQRDVAKVTYDEVKAILDSGGH